ncbi:unnamed protein product [Adineta steineri]|uniref:V-type proton ATPase subunit G n=1 Tax=Adineta steineri TaxID=433720 RepID=A0A818MH74_9BILA|nr:unnamed protein product [Adineta steineri]
MADHNTRKHMDNLNNKKLSPSSAINQVIVSSRHPSMRSTSASNSSKSRVHQHSSIQMEPGIQALLAAEGQAAEMITRARANRNKLMRQCNRESHIEIETFRQEREAQYKRKLYEATQLEQFQEKLDFERFHLLKQIKENVKKEQKSLIKYIIHCVIDQIPVKPHPNAKHILNYRL